MVLNFCYGQWLYVNFYVFLVHSIQSLVCSVVCFCVLRYSYVYIFTMYPNNNFLSNNSQLFYWCYFVLYVIWCFKWIFNRQISNFIGLHSSMLHMFLPYRLLNLKLQFYLSLQPIWPHSTLLNVQLCPLCTSGTPFFAASEPGHSLQLSDTMWSDHNKKNDVMFVHLYRLYTIYSISNKWGERWHQITANEEKF